MVTATADEEKGEFCVTVSLAVTRIVGRTLLRDLLIMRYINLHFTYFIYLHTDLVG